jgi:hypothetical protein
MRSAEHKHGLPMAEIQLPSPRRRGLHIVHAVFFVKVSAHSFHRSSFAQKVAFAPTKPL